MSGVPSHVAAYDDKGDAQLWVMAMTNLMPIVVGPNN